MIVSKGNCPICDSGKVASVYVSRHSPLARYGFMDNLEQALLARSNYPLNIQQCFDCGFAYNSDYDPANVNYDELPIYESAHHSVRYQEFQSLSAKKLSEIIDLKNAQVTEIGGGDGNFIRQIDCRNKLLFEPSQESQIENVDIKIIHDYFNPTKHALTADLVIMRQVLEHIPKPQNFLKQLLNKLKPSSLTFPYIYIEVPSHDATIAAGRFYDFYYEHCNYFTQASLYALGENLGLQCIYSSPGMNGELTACLFKANSQYSFDPAYYKTKKDIVLSQFENLFNAGMRVALWGASGNGVALLNSLEISHKKLPYVIDSDIRKVGMFIPVTGQLIISPYSEEARDIDALFICSQFHYKEIAYEATQILGKHVKYYDLHNLREV